MKYAKYKSWIKDYCSHTCARKANPVTGEKVSINCQNCKQVFTLLSSTKRAREKNGNTIKYCSKNCESEARTYLTVIKCDNCSVEFKPRRNDTKYCSRACSDESFKKNGKSKRDGYWYENGYRVLYTEDGKGIKEHIKVMEDSIGRKLFPNEVVHHMNEDKLDNKIENLQLMTRGEHSRLHRLLELERGQSLFGR